MDVIDSRVVGVLKWLFKMLSKQLEEFKTIKKGASLPELSCLLESNHALQTIKIIQTYYLAHKLMGNFSLFNSPQKKHFEATLPQPK